MKTVKQLTYLLNTPRFMYLGFNVAFKNVQVISRRVVLWAEETSTYSWSMVLYCKLPTICKQLTTSPHRLWGLNHGPRRWEASVLPMCNWIHLRVTITSYFEPLLRLCGSLCFDLTLVYLLPPVSLLVFCSYQSQNYVASTSVHIIYHSMFLVQDKIYFQLITDLFTNILYLFTLRFASLLKRRTFQYFTRLYTRVSIICSSVFMVNSKTIFCLAFCFAFIRW